MSLNQRGTGRSSAVEHNTYDLGDAKTDSLYRRNDQKQSKFHPQNMMYDSRVLRGNNYPAPTTSGTLNLDSKRKVDGTLGKSGTYGGKTGVDVGRAPSTPPPVSGRRHVDINTDEYLEELVDRRPEEEVGVQTDANMDRPPSPIFVPKPMGFDVGTQIEPGELFDFDYEVAPLLDVLVGKTMEQAITELMRENELANIARQQAEFDAVRAAQLAEAKRVEDEIRRCEEEKAQKKAAAELKARREASVRSKVAATHFSKSYLSALRTNLFAKLHERGHFYDPINRAMEVDVIPRAIEAAATRVAVRDGLASSLVDDIVLSALQRAAHLYEEHQKALAEAAAAEAARQAELAAEEAARRAAEEAKAAEETEDADEEVEEE